MYLAQIFFGPRSAAHAPEITVFFLFAVLATLTPDVVSAADDLADSGSTDTTALTSVRRASRNCGSFSPVTASRLGYAHDWRSLVAAMTAGNTPAVAQGSDTVFANGFDNAGSECLTFTDCRTPDSVCYESTCTDGLCGELDAPFGTVCDEYGGVCDGAGSCLPGTPQCVSAADCPPPSGECFQSTCTGGVCGESALPAGTLCTGGQCDGTGVCLQTQ